MLDINLEEKINKALAADIKGRRTIPVAESRWGELIVPAYDENPSKTKEGLRVVVFGSYLLGFVLHETLKVCEKKYPARLNIKALVTDESSNPEANISLRKRTWRLHKSGEKFELEKIMVESALSFGIPCYTGEVKIEYFHRLLKIWNPDAIISCDFGQLIDTPIINFPDYGFYNFHHSVPADKLNSDSQGLEDLIAGTAGIIKVAICQQTNAGSIVAQSAPINVKMKNGETSDNVFVIYDKIIPAIHHMAAALISELILRKERNEKGSIQNLNIDDIFPESCKTKLMKPIISNVPNEILPVPDKNIVFFN